MAKLTPSEDKLRKAIIQGYERLLRKTQCSYPYVTLEEVRRVLAVIGEPPDKTYHLDHVFPLDAFVKRHKSSPLTEKEVRALNSPKNLKWCHPSVNMSKQAKHNGEEFKIWLEVVTKEMS